MEPSDVSLQVMNPTLQEIVTPEFLALLRARGVREASAFGSVVHGTARPDSDIDLLVTLFQQIDLAEELSRLCGRRVDLMTKIHPAFESYIIPTLVPFRCEEGLRAAPRRQRVAPRPRARGRCLPLA